MIQKRSAERPSQFMEKHNPQRLSTLHFFLLKEESALLENVNKHKTCFKNSKVCKIGRSEVFAFKVETSSANTSFLQCAKLGIPFLKKILRFSSQGFSWAIKLSLYNLDYFLLGLDLVKEHVKRFYGFLGYSVRTSPNGE